jgi:hypothetical protein
MTTVSLVADVHSTLGESPIWSERTGTLYHVDISTRRVFGTVNGRTLAPLVLPQQVGCVVPRSSGGLVAATETDLLPCSVEEGTVGAPLLTFPASPGVRFNDGKADPQGRLWVGNMHAAWRDPASPPATLFCVRPGASSPPTLALPPSWFLGGGAFTAAAAALAVGKLRSRSSAALGVSVLAAASLAAAALAASGAGGVAAGVLHAATGAWRPGGCDRRQ